MEGDILPDETRPLISTNMIAAVAPSGDDASQHRDSVIHELWWLLSAATPLIGSYYLHYSFGFLNLISLGMWGSKALGAYALANMTCSILAFAPATGVASALDTLCSAAFSHFGSGRQVSLHLQRGLAAVTIWYFFVLAIIQLGIGSIYDLIGQDKTIAQPAASYLRVLSLGLWPWMAFECLKRYIQSNTQMRLPALVLANVIPIHLLGHWLFVWRNPDEVAFTAVAWITVVSYWLMFLGVAICTLWWDSLRPAWAIHGVKQLVSARFYSLALPAMIEACGEFMAFEIMTLLATYLGPTSLAAQAIAFNSMSMVYQLPHGVGGAAAVRIGRLLGQGNGIKAKFSAKVLVVGGLIYSVLGMCFFTLYGKQWIAMYTKDEEVLAVAVQLIGIVVVMEWTDAIRGIVPGILRGMGKQRRAAAINVGSYYFVVLPLAVLAIFVFGHGILGLWASFALGMFVLSGSYIATIIATNWDREVDRCAARIVTHP